MTFARQTLGSLLPLVFGIAASIALARLLSAEARGEYDLAVRLPGLVLAFAQWGIPEVLLQFVSPGREADRPGDATAGDLGALAGTSLALGAAAALIGGAAIGVLTPLLQDSVLRGVDTRLVLLALLGGPVVLAGLFARRFIQLRASLTVYNALDLARNAVFLVLAVTLAKLVTWSALGVVLAWFLSELVLTLAAVWYMRRRVVAAWRFDSRLAGRLARAGLPVQAGLIAVFLGNEGGRYVLNGALDLASVGIYAVALSVARLVLQVSQAMRTALQPRLVVAERDAAALTARITRHGVLLMLVGSALLAMGSPLMGLVFGATFAASGPVMVLMLPGMVAYGVAQLAGSHLLRAGWRGSLAVSSCAFAAGSLVFQAIGASVGGVSGAALGLSAGYLLMAATVIAPFCALTHTSPAVLVPGWEEVAYYLALARRVISRSAFKWQSVSRRG